MRAGPSHHSPGWSRRNLLAGLAAGTAAAAAGQAPRTGRRSRLILLGTKGGPTPSAFRAPAASLLVVDDVPYIIDCPDGVARQLVLAGVELPKLRDLFITHHHSDHMAGLGSLLLLAWGAGLKTPVTAYGPPPIGEIVRAGLASGAFDIEARIREEGRPPLQRLVTARPLTGKQIVLPGPPVRVTCAPVDHYTVPALAYRFDTPDRSFVFSGDTAPSSSLIKLAKGADVLVHEAMLLAGLDRLKDGNAPKLRDHLLKSHTTTEQLGQVAAAAGVRTVVLSHLVPAFADISDGAWAEGVRKHFHGEIIVGRDLMEI